MVVNKYECRCFLGAIGFFNCKSFTGYHLYIFNFKTCPALCLCFFVANNLITFPTNGLSVFRTSSSRQTFRLIAAGLRPCNDAPLASLEKISFGFFPIPLRGTEPKDAPYARTGVTVRRGGSKYPFSKL